MAIEPLEMGAALTAAAVVPVILKRNFKMPSYLTFFNSVAISFVLKELVIWVAYPNFQHDGLYGVNIVMYVFICSIVVGSVMLTLHLVK